MLLRRDGPAAAQSDLDQKIDSNIADWVGTYKHLHANPELSTQEKETSALVAGTLRKLGYEVTDHFGEYEDPKLVSYGVVAVLKNGSGPTVYVRTELDALPVRENTGLPYASKVTVKRATDEVGVMHACGHDLHMTVFLGTRENVARRKKPLERHGGDDCATGRGNRWRSSGDAARGIVSEISQARLCGGAA